MPRALDGGRGTEGKGVQGQARAQEGEVLRAWDSEGTRRRVRHQGHGTVMRMQHICVHITALYRLCGVPGGQSASVRAIGLEVLKEARTA